jgi:cell wall-associated NlpC family hydrolase
MKFTIYIFTVAVLFSSFTIKKEEKIVKNQIQEIQSIIDRDAIITYSKQYLGTPYVYAGNNPKKGFDCSGFVNYVFQYFDINLPRSSGAYKNIGKAKSPEDFKVGDILVFYGYKDRKSIGHLGIICEANGMKSKFIHASSGKTKSVTISALESNHYSNRFYKCINVLPK